MSDIAEVAASLDRQRRLAWAKFYELARLVLADTDEARQVAAAVLRTEAELDPPAKTSTLSHAALVAASLNGYSDDIVIAGRRYVRYWDGEWYEAPTPTGESVDVREQAQRIRESLRGNR